MVNVTENFNTKELLRFGVRKTLIVKNKSLHLERQRDNLSSKHKYPIFSQNIFFIVFLLSTGDLGRPQAYENRTKGIIMIRFLFCLLNYKAKSIPQTVINYRTSG